MVRNGRGFKSPSPLQKAKNGTSEPGREGPVFASSGEFGDRAVANLATLERNERW